MIETKAFIIICSILIAPLSAIYVAKKEKIILPEVIAYAYLMSVLLVILLDAVGIL